MKLLKLFRPRRIGLKLLLVLTPLIFAYSLLVSLMGPYQYRKQAFGATSDRAKSIGQMLSYSLSPALYFNDSKTIDEVFQSARQNKDLAFFVLLDNSGKIVASYNQKIAERANYLRIKNGDISSGESLYTSTTPVLYKDRAIGQLYLGFSLEEVLQKIGSIRKDFILFSFILFGLGIIAIFGMSSLITRPMRRMAHTTGQIAKGDLTQRTTVTSKDEIGQLAQSFNIMVENLGEARRTLENKVDERTKELQIEIAERKRAEEALRLSEELLRDMVESMGEGIGIADLEERFTFANPASDHLFGLPRGGLVGRALNEFMTTEQFAAIQEQTKRRQKGEKATYEFEIIRPSGEKRTVRVGAIPRFNKQGQYAGSLGVFSDITERKKWEQAIQEANEKLMLSVKELEQRNREMGYFSELYDEFQTCKEEKEIYERTSVYARKFFPEASGELHIYKASKNFLEPVISWGDLPLREDFLMPDDCLAMRRSKIYKVEDPRSGLLCGHVRDSGRKPRPYLCIPMISRDGPIGLLHLEFFKSGEIQREDWPSVKMPERLAASFAERVSLALHNMNLSQKLKQQSIRDALTGLYNRRYMEDSLERDVLRAKRRNDPLGIIMLDLDHFKHFNDTYGHEAGDLMLREVGTFLQANVRQEDIVCRYGGEEFLIVLQGASLEAADHRAERLLDLSKNLHIQYHGETLGPITFSMGVACLPDHGSTGGEIIVAADMALFRAKKAGRNRIVVSGE